MSPILIEVIGICATVLILFSMMFKTTTLKGDIRMRILNLIGSIIFTVYGCLLPALSTAILNGALIIINTYHLVTLIKEKKSQPNDEKQQ
ncbi:MAG: hypothetical protein IKJ33_01870 [Clostridia bacterium]|nr:hypothetical protein [Clostridia bacterium]